MATMRCKLQVIEIDKSYFPQPEDEASCKVKMGAVWEGSTENQQASENAVFGKWTPQAAFEAVIKNPNVVAKLEKGQVYYLDFTLVEGEETVLGVPYPISK